MTCTGGTLTAGNISIGSLDATTRLLLQVLIDNYDTLSTDRGVQQAESLLKFYLSSVKQSTDETPSNSEPSQLESQNLKEPTQEKIEPETSPDVLTIPSFETPPNWRLHELKCRSIKGVAPAGEGERDPPGLARADDARDARAGDAQDRRIDR